MLGGLQPGCFDFRRRNPMDVNAWGAAIPPAAASGVPDAPSSVEGLRSLGGYVASERGFWRREATPRGNGTLLPVSRGDPGRSFWECQPLPPTAHANQSCRSGTGRSDYLHGLTRRLGRDGGVMMPTLASGEAHTIDPANWTRSSSKIAPIPVEYRESGRGLKNEWQIARLLPGTVPSGGFPRLPTHSRWHSDWDDEALHAHTGTHHSLESMQHTYPTALPISRHIACQISGNPNTVGTSVPPMMEMEMSSCPVPSYPSYPSKVASDQQNSSSPTHLTGVKNELGSGDGVQIQQDSDSEFDFGESPSDPLDELLDMLVDDSRSGTDVDGFSKDTEVPIAVNQKPHGQIHGGLESQGSWSGISMTSQPPLAPTLFPGSVATSPATPPLAPFDLDSQAPMSFKLDPELKLSGSLCGSFKAEEQKRLSPTRDRSVDVKTVSTPMSDESSTSVAVGCSPRAVSTPAGASSKLGRRLRIKTSEHTGVSKHRKSGRWEVHIWVGSLGKQVYLGGYDDADAAAEAYDIVQIRTRGDEAKTNFPRSRYKDILGFIRSKSLPELIAHIRRGSKGFSRGLSEYRGVTLNPNGRWEARIGAYGSRHVYLGLYAPQKEAAIHYDTALVRLRGHNAATNFALSNYKRALEEHRKLVEAYGDTCISSLGRIPSLKTKFEQFLKAGGCELDALIAAIRRLDSRERPFLPKTSARKNASAKRALKAARTEGNEKKSIE